MSFEVVEALDEGALVDLLGGGLALGAEAVNVFEAGEDFSGSRTL